MFDVFLDTHFCLRDLLLLSTAGLIFILALLFAFRQQFRKAIVFLFFSGLLFRLAAVLMDPFVYDWDEQFHALVARNLTEHPFRPMLYADPALPYDPNFWAGNHIWLHKQPFFLWLIAGSLKLFGFTPFAVKLPSLLLSSLMIPALYRIGKLLIGDLAGFYAAALLAIGQLFMELPTGRLHTDHNDVVFAALILFSVWAFVEYLVNKKQKWSMLVGVFAGCAVLTKWLPGMFVLGIWLMYILFNRKHRQEKKAWRDILRASLTMIGVALPWQIYILFAFPAESSYEYHYTALHFTIPMEGHAGTRWYHFEQLGEQLGYGLAWFSAAGLFSLLFIRNQRIVLISIVFACIGWFSFYTLAATKMPLFCFPVYPLLMLGCGFILQQLSTWLIQWRKGTSFILFPTLLIGAWFVLDLSKTERLHTLRDGSETFRAMRMHDHEAALRIHQNLGEGRWLVFGVPHPIPFMFYTGYTAYAEIPEQNKIDELTRKGWKIAVCVSDKPELERRNVRVVHEQFTQH